MRSRAYASPPRVGDAWTKARLPVPAVWLTPEIVPSMCVTRVATPPAAGTAHTLAVPRSR